MKEKINRYPKTSGQFFEAMRSLAANIEFSSIDKPVRSISIASTIPSEGKSTIAIYLAKAFAQMGRNTLLVEADLRHPVIAKRLEFKKKDGFINYLTGQCSFEDVLSPVEPNLSFINCGATPPNAIEILSSERFANFSKEVHGKFEIIIYDNPPLGVFVDAAIVSNLCDGTVYIVDSGTVDYKKAQTAVEQLRKANARILGVVLNNVDTETSGYYYYYDYGNRRRRRRKYASDYTTDPYETLPTDTIAPK